MCLIETVLLSTHNISFGWEIKKIVFQYILLSGALTLTRHFTCRAQMKGQEPF